MRLLEIVRGAKTSPETIAKALALAKQLKKVGVVAGNCDGFIGNRMLHQLQARGRFLLEEGATPQQVDGVIKDFGFADGAVRDGRSRRARRRLAHPQAPQRDLAADGTLLEGRRRALRDGPLRAEDRRRLLPLRAGEPHADPRPGGRRGHRAKSRREAGIARRDDLATTRSSSAACTRSSTRRRRSSTRASPRGRATSTSSGCTATASRRSAAARCAGRTPSGCRTSSTTCSRSSARTASTGRRRRCCGSLPNAAATFGAWKRGAASEGQAVTAHA